MSRPNSAVQRGRATLQPDGWLAVARAAAFLENARQRHHQAGSHVGAGAVRRRATAAAPIVPGVLASAGLALGAGAVDQLLAAIGGISDDGLQCNAGGDMRDYFEIAAAIEAFLADYAAAPAEQRHGVLLALAVVLCAEADNRFGADDAPNPLADVAQAMQDRAAQRTRLRPGAGNAKGTDALTGRTRP